MNGLWEWNNSILFDLNYNYNEIKLNYWKYEVYVQFLIYSTYVDISSRLYVKFKYQFTH